MFFLQANFFSRFLRESRFLRVFGGLSFLLPATLMLPQTLDAQELSKLTLTQLTSLLQQNADTTSLLETRLAERSQQVQNFQKSLQEQTRFWLEAKTDLSLAKTQLEASQKAQAETKNSLENLEKTHSELSLSFEAFKTQAANQIQVVESQRDRAEAKNKFMDGIVWALAILATGEAGYIGAQKMGWVK